MITNLPRKRHHKHFSERAPHNGGKQQLVRTWIMEWRNYVTVTPRRHSMNYNSSIRNVVSATGDDDCTANDAAYSANKTQMAVIATSPSAAKAGSTIVLCLHYKWWILMNTISIVYRLQYARENMYSFTRLILSEREVLGGRTLL